MAQDVFKQAMELADATRKRLDLDNAPIKNIFSIIESEGILLVLAPIDAEGLSGAFFHDEKEDLSMILVNNTMTPGRQVFTAAHEFCHYLVDRDDQSAIIDFMHFTQKSPIEQRADAFAANFLMPEQGVLRFIKETLGISNMMLDDFSIAKVRYEYGTSWTATLYRLKSLGFSVDLPWDQKVRQTAALNIVAMQLGMEPELRPANPELRLPSKFTQEAYTAFNEEKISMGRLAELLRKSRFEVEDLLSAAKEDEL